MYFQLFPEEVRPRTLITRDRDEIKAFAKEEGTMRAQAAAGIGRSERVSGSAKATFPT